MSLFRQVLLVLLATCILVAGTGFSVSLLQARSSLQMQLSAAATDTAHSLGLSLVPALRRHDQVLAETMMRAIFDRGYYRRIVLLDPAGHVLRRYESTWNGEDVPAWFRHLLVLRAQSALTQIDAGWVQQGSLIVESSAGEAYRQMWAMAVQEAQMDLLVTLILILAAYVALRWMTHPLKAIEMQAQAIMRREFVEIDRMPHTRELRQVVQAMNRMSRQVSALVDDLLHQVESLRQQAYVDTVTGLANQRAFDNGLAARLADSESRSVGAMIILQVDEFARLNARVGSDLADQLLMQIAGRFSHLAQEYPAALVARRHGADFVAFLPGLQKEEAESCLDALLRAVASLPLVGEWQDLVYYAGMAYADLDSEPGELLPRASVALRLAREGGVRGSHILQASSLQSHALSLLGHGLDSWRARLDLLLQQDRLCLFYQPCVDFSGGLLHKEILVRLDVDGQLLMAAHLLPLVERLGWEGRLDAMVLDKVLRYQRDAAALGLPLDRLSVNLSPYSLRSAAVRQELMERLRQDEDLLPMLQIEVAESALVLAPQAVREFATWLENAGAGLVIDRYAMRQQSLAVLGSLSLRAIKLDMALVRDVVDSPDHRFLLSTLRHAAHSRDMLLLADSVESTEQWQVLKELKVDGGQGFLLARPKALEVLPHAI